MLVVDVDKINTPQQAAATRRLADDQCSGWGFVEYNLKTLESSRLSKYLFSCGLVFWSCHGGEPCPRDAGNTDAMQSQGKEVLAVIVRDSLCT